MSIKTRTSGIMVDINVTPAATAYQGPGDVATGMTAVAWGGLMAFNAAYAASLGAAIDLADAGNVLGGTVHVKADGTLNITELDALIAGGFTKAIQIYDQTGNGNHFTDALNRMPIISKTSGPNGGLTLDFAAGSYFPHTVTTTVTIAQPYFYTGVLAVRTTAAGGLFFAGSDSNAARNMKYLVGTGYQIDLGNGPGATVAGTAGTFYHVVGMGSGPGTANIWIDTNTNSQAAMGNTGYAAEGIGFGVAVAAGTFDGFVSELGYWSGDVTAVQAALNTNAHTRWNFF